MRSSTTMGPATWTATFYFYFWKKLIYFSEGSTLTQFLKIHISKTYFNFSCQNPSLQSIILSENFKWDKFWMIFNHCAMKGYYCYKCMNWNRGWRKKCWNLFLIFQCKVGVKRWKKNFTWKFTPIVLLFNTRVEITTVEHIW